MKNLETKRLYVFTGKGGVGKTTMALSFASYLQSHEEKVLFVSFEESPYAGIYKELKLNYLILDLYASTKLYIGKRLGSQVVASWIMGTQFFRAMLNIVPGFSYLIFLGHILDQIYHDPELVVVFDSPSSGHALTMFESLTLFKEIFQSGILFEDIITILKLIDQQDFLKINIGSVPTVLALQEAKELKEKLNSLVPKHSEIFINNSLLADPLLRKAASLPGFLEKKLGLEQEAFEQYKEEIKASLPHVSSLEYAQIIEGLAPFMKALL